MYPPSPSLEVCCLHEPSKKKKKKKSPEMLLTTNLMVLKFFKSILRLLIGITLKSLIHRFVFEMPGKAN